MKILYGTDDLTIDVTQICYNKLLIDDKICIPSGNLYRSLLFTNKIFNTKRNIYIHIGNQITICNEYTLCCINIKTLQLQLFNEYDTIVNCNDKKFDNLLLNKNNEFKEIIKSDDKVCIFGSNKCEYTLNVCQLLSCKSNCITLEPNKEVYNLLDENRLFTNSNYYLENKVLYYKKCIIYNDNILPSDILLDNYNWVENIDILSLHEKYNIEFDTIVIEYSNMLYHLCREWNNSLMNCNLLDNLKCIIVKNEFKYQSDKNYVEKILNEYNFNKKELNNIIVWKK